MSAVTEKKSTLWLFALALAWPMDIYQTLPGVGVPLSLVLTVGYLVTVVLERRRYGFQMPIELWWPVIPMVILGLSLVSYADGFIFPVESVFAALMFVAVGATVRNRYLVEWALFLSVMSGSVLAVLNIAAFKSGIPTTSYVMESGAMMVGSSTVSGGILQMALLFIAGVGLAWRSGFGPLHRTAATFASIALGGAFAGKVWQGRNHAYDWGQTLIGSQPPVYWAALALLLWLVARLAGKMAVDWKTSGGRLQVFFLAGLFFAVAYSTLVPIPIRMHDGLLLGLLAAYVLPGREDKPYYFISPAWYALPVVLIALLVLNLPGLTPRSGIDNRNFDHAASLDESGEAYYRLRWRMENLYMIYPSASSRLGVWQARASINLEQYERGSLEYMWALRQNSDDEEVFDHADSVIVRYRDLDSSVDADTLYYVRVLAAQEGIEAVLPILALKAENRSEGEVSLVPEALQAAGLAFLLGDLEWEDMLAGEAAGAMGCDEVTDMLFSAENTFPMDALLVGYLRTPEGPRVLAASPKHRAESEFEIKQEWQVRPESIGEGTTELWLDDSYTLEDGGQQSVAIIYGRGEDAVALAYIFANADGSLAVNWNTALGIREFPYAARAMVLHRP